MAFKERSSDSTKYLHIYERLRNDITSGVYPRGSKLPSKRDMADSCSVSLITVEHAYELLADEGYITPEEKRGYFVTYDESEMFPVGTHHTAAVGTPVLGTQRSGMAVSPVSDTYLSDTAPSPVSDTCRSDMTASPVSDAYRSGMTASPVSDAYRSGMAPAPVSDAVKHTDTRALPFPIYARTVRHVISTYGDVLASRSPGFGCECLRFAVASYLRRSRHMDVSPDRVVIGSGAEYLYSMIVKALGRDLIYAVESPSYHRIAQIYGAEGVSLEQLPLGSDGIESNALRSSEARVLHITPYRSFPSGVTASASKKHEYLRFSHERNAVIIEDDAESEFSPLRKPEETLYALDGGDNVIYVNTFTRTIGSFLRVAYMVVPERLAGLFGERIGMYACTVPTLEQYVLAELLDKGDFERHINRVRRKEREHEHIRSTG